MRFRKLVVVGLVGFASFAFNVATAQDAGGPTIAAVENVSFADPPGERSFAEGGAFDLSIINTDFGARFTNLAPDRPDSDVGGDSRGYEVALTRTGVGGLVDVSFAQRGALSVDENGDIAGESRGSELRLGRGLGIARGGQPSRTPTWYFFAASDDEALVWRPGARRQFGSNVPAFALQDQVEIGDMSAGITYEMGSLQASLAYVEREISVRTAGSHTISSDERFAGFTLTMRR